MATDERRIIKHRVSSDSNGAVIYRMSRDQRVKDNWALLFAIEMAKENNAPLAVVFTLDPGYISANLRHFDFMLKGLDDVSANLKELNIPFIVLKSENPSKTLAEFIETHNVKTVVTDFDPLRHKQQWVKDLCSISSISLYEVDTHNIVPCRFVSQKAEFGAYTLRPKIRKYLNEFLTEIPYPEKCTVPWQGIIQEYSSTGLLSDIPNSTNVLPVSWILPGEGNADKAVKKFLSSKLNGYNTKRNDPTLSWQSDLSPYLHFGQLSAQRVAIETVKMAGSNEDSDAFMEELIVRRELADNFCFYNKSYDTIEGFPDWAKKDIEQHRSDPREYLYSLSLLEKATTHDPLWNAAQKEMVNRGKMHGYLRMYWAKKIMEWTPDIETAISYAIYLNDKYSLDGRDPNGYAGIAWSVGGVHDRAWFPRNIFGKIRYMSYNGCKGKFDIAAYIRLINGERELPLW